MGEKINYDILLDILMGDLKTEDSLATVLNFLEHAASVIRHLYWAKRINRENSENKKVI